MAVASKTCNSHFLRGSLMKAHYTAKMCMVIADLKQGQDYGAKVTNTALKNCDISRFC